MIVLLAPAPSATKSIAERAAAKGLPVGAVTTAYQLVDDPEFIAASDAAWWSKYDDLPDCAHYSMMQSWRARDKRTQVVEIAGMGVVNSGVLALEVAKRRGHKEILLAGFDMTGTHFFGRYTNGLANTTEKRRDIHLKQYQAWAKNNSKIKVLNITANSRIDCFERVNMGDYL